MTIRRACPICLDRRTEAHSYGDHHQWDIPYCRACTHEGRRHLIDHATITLDGQPAVIMGAREDHATIAQLNGPIAHQWAWPTVQRVATTTGAFTS